LSAGKNARLFYFLSTDNSSVFHWAVEYFPQCQPFADNIKIKQADFNTTTIKKCGRALA
jgi:hypothetical protein